MRFTLAQPIECLIAPLLFVQGKRVRRDALRLPEPEGARSGIRGSGPPLGMLILGDSSAAGVGVSDQRQALSGCILDRIDSRFRVTWQVIAKTASTTADIHARLGEIDLTQVDCVVTSLGLNDVTGSTRQEDWQGSYRGLRETLRAQFGARRFYISGLPPAGKFPLLPQPLRWVLGRQTTRFDQALIRDLSYERDCTHILLEFDDDPTLMAEDGYHPGPEVYRMWGDRVAQQILTDFG